MDDLTTLDNVKAWLGLTSATDDDLLMRLITAQSRYIQTWLNRDLSVQAYTETRDGNGGQRLMLTNYPVIAVSSVVVDGVAIPFAGNVFTFGYDYSDGMSITLRGYVFARGLNNVTVTYSAGYAEVPEDIEQACIELVALRYKERDRIGHTSKSIGGETVAYMVRDFPESVRTLLNNYRKVVPL